MNGINQTRIWIARAVVVLWTTAGVVAFFTSNFEELGIITPVMMVVVSFLFGYRIEPKPEKKGEE